MVEHEVQKGDQGLCLPTAWEWLGLFQLQDLLLYFPIGSSDAVTLAIGIYHKTPLLCFSNVSMFSVILLLFVLFKINQR